MSRKMASFSRQARRTSGRFMRPMYRIMNVGTSQEAASDFWKFLQIFFADSRFSKYQKNEFAIWTESYGGHYGPTFAA